MTLKAKDNIPSQLQGLQTERGAFRNCLPASLKQTFVFMASVNLHVTRASCSTARQHLIPEIMLDVLLLFPLNSQESFCTETQNVHEPRRHQLSKEKI